MTREEAIKQFTAQFIDAEADEKKLPILSGLIEEAYDCKMELIKLKDKIRELEEKGARFTVIARREKLLVQKRQSYTNMLGRICKEMKKKEDLNKVFDDSEGLEDYE